MEFRFQNEKDMWKLGLALLTARTDTRERVAEEENMLRALAGQVSSSMGHVQFIPSDF